MRIVYKEGLRTEIVRKLETTSHVYEDNCYDDSNQFGCITHTSML